MPIKRGKKHTYVGMDLDFSNNGEVIVTMDNYIEECIDEFPDVIKRESKTPATDNLLKVDKFSRKLGERQKSFSTD